MVKIKKDQKKIKKRWLLAKSQWALHKRFYFFRDPAGDECHAWRSVYDAWIASWNTTRRAADAAFKLYDGKNQELKAASEEYGMESLRVSLLFFYLHFFQFLKKMSHADERHASAMCTSDCLPGGHWKKAFVPRSFLVRVQMLISRDKLGL